MVNQLSLQSIERAINKPELSLTSSARTVRLNNLSDGSAVPATEDPSLRAIMLSDQIHVIFLICFYLCFWNVGASSAITMPPKRR
uniref:Glutamyl-tRNA amidotransferase subunit C n=1 Tax=Aegilops tauschii subsp. strangulata TaxID=200361 RepID=A0A453LPQ1_AEGTS